MTGQAVGIKGVHRRDKVRADGRRWYTYYVSRAPGAPAFWGPTTERVFTSKSTPPEFALAYAKAMKVWTEDLRARRTPGDMARFIAAWQRSPKFQNLAPETRKGYARYLERIGQDFGSASIAVLESRKMRGEFLTWHEALAQTSPKGADDAVTVLSNVLDFAVRRGELLVNHADKIDRAYVHVIDPRPIPASVQARFLAGCDPVTARIFDAAIATGLRRADLAGLTWPEWQGGQIVRKTSKGRGRRTATVPLPDQSQALLEALKRDQLSSPLGLQPTVLVGKRGRPLQPKSLGDKVNNRFKAIGEPYTLHNCRNTFATLLVRAGFDRDTIARIMGWSQRQVDDLVEIYVPDQDVIAWRSAQITKARKT